MTLAFLFTTLFFMVAVIGTTSNEVLRLSVTLIAYSFKRGFACEFSSTFRRSQAEDAQRFT
jgi:hypothetical protein